MNNNCLTSEDFNYTSPLLNERNKRLGRNFLYTVLVFTVLCVASYMING
jgi:hypothetical protein